MTASATHSQRKGTVVKKKTRKRIEFSAPKRIKKSYSWSGGSYFVNTPTVKKRPLAEVITMLQDAASELGADVLVGTEYLSITLHGERDETPKEKERRIKAEQRKVAQAVIEKKREAIRAQLTALENELTETY